MNKPIKTMDKKLKARWVKALRSGRYRQATGNLYERAPEAFCCLGVLCLIAGASRELMADAAMPLSIEGFENIIDQKLANKLASFNDDDEMPFELIAGFVNEVA